MSDFPGGGGVAEQNSNRESQTYVEGLPVVPHMCENMCSWRNHAFKRNDINIFARVDIENDRRKTLVCQVC